MHAPNPKQLWADINALCRVSSSAGGNGVSSSAGGNGVSSSAGGNGVSSSAGGNAQVCYVCMPTRRDNI